MTFEADDTVEIFSLLKATDDEMTRLSRDGMLALNLEEMRSIRRHFDALGRDPTDVEMETLAQTWSEHCKHKVFNGVIDYVSGRKTERIDNLFARTIRKATEDIRRAQGPNDRCVSVFVDNAGIIEFDEDYHLVFKVETHNHPSALDPYGGANTGIGGVIRDPLGTGLGGKPIFNTDVFCFAPPDFPYDDLPEGVLHPKRVFKGVVAGVRDYGNRMGIPTVNGAILFDERYLGNPLVYCGTAAVIPVDRCEKSAEPGDLVVTIGGRTGRDGIHGATFSSIELTDASESTATQAVQIGNPIEEKKILDVLMQARDRGLYRNITDCGAGGFSSAIGEMGEDTGAEVHLEKAPLKYGGLKPWEIFLSESQERMILAVPPEHIESLRDLCASEDVEASVIGEFTGDRRLRVTHKPDAGESRITVADLDMEFLHKGVPRIVRTARWEPPDHPEPPADGRPGPAQSLVRLLSSWNVASKEWVVRQYDHEVQGGSVLKPLQGARNDGPGDAAVVRPVLSSDRGVIVANGINPSYGDVDPYWMAASAIDEALRQVTCVGGRIDRTALLDNFCWGNPDKPDRLAALVRAAKACYDIAVAYGTPFISGKDSFYNEFSDGERTIAIPPTLLISAICVMDDVRKAVSMDVKAPGSSIYVVGRTRDELGGSRYYRMLGFVGRNAPTVDAATGSGTMNRLHEAISQGLVAACHDCSEGGLAVAAAEMAFAGGYGMVLDLDAVPLDPEADRDDTVLFSESNSRFVVEVPSGREAEFDAIMEGSPFGRAGTVTGEERFLVRGLDGDEIVSTELSIMKEAWQRPLRW
ncbi:MAG: phosphoribosylformylglycinamidine synthase subunit PurL [Gemmatimonadota bacterium]|nr:phosphoribosylformylglycinamidine synthase subunit PurL [Gemmatimonadota bacterium]